jgi:hypothetical protein
MYKELQEIAMLKRQKRYCYIKNAIITSKMFLL